MLAILLALQREGTLRAEDLAETFQVSKRSIYRDLEALCEAGVPVMATPGKGYSLMKGYFLPPLSFTVEEASILILGAEAVASNFDEEYRAAARSAADKITTALPDRLRHTVASIRQGIRFFRSEGSESPEVLATIRTLRRAIIEQRNIRIRYNRRCADTTPELHSPRRIDPYALNHINGIWYLAAYCHERRSIRNFRLSRIMELELLATTFERPAGLTTARRAGLADCHYEARVLFSADAAPWVREMRYFHKVSEEEHPDGLLVTLRARAPADLLPWILSWGSHVQVLGPEDLVDAVTSEIKKMIERHTTDPLLT